MAARLNARGTTIGRLDEHEVGLARFSKHPRWEIHPHGDELLIGIAGDLELTILSDDGPFTTVLQARHAIVIPRNTWHSPTPLSEVSLLNMADYERTAVSDALDPHRAHSVSERAPIGVRIGSGGPAIWVGSVPFGCLGGLRDNCCHGAHPVTDVKGL